MRILLSAAAEAALRNDIADIFAGRPFEVLTPRDGLTRDFDVAFVSRDVTGNSTKFVLEPHTQSFYDALRQSSALRWVHVHSAGADRAIYLELQARGVEVTPSAGANAAIVAQTALAGILALARRFPLLMEQQRKREWKSLFTALPSDLEGQVAVTVGWGTIGQKLAAWLEAIGVEVRVVRNSNEPAAARRTFAYDALAEAASGADWLVVACPLSDRTRRMVDARVFASLAEGAHFVNVGRGEVVVEADLIAALDAGRLAGAFLDVFEHEPLPAESPLWAMPNVIVTPHSAGLSGGNEARVAQMFLAHLRRRLAPA